MRSLALTDTAAGRRLCSDCATGLNACVSCAEVTFTGLRTDTGGFVCGICAHQLFDQCFRCERFTRHSRYVVGNHRTCPTCAQELCACPDCGTLLAGRRGCDRCADRHTLWNYTYRPDPIFHGTGPLFLGLELEVVVPEDCFDDAIATATDTLGSLGYLKRDSSIRPMGFEIVCHPMTYQYALTEFPWQVLHQLARLGCETGAGVGLHVHASRAGFTGPAHIFRWMKLVYRNSDQVSRLARRTSRYAPFEPDTRSRAKDLAKGARHAVGLPRYQAINPHPRDTLELRVFASALDPGQVQAALAFTEASIAYTADLTVAQIHAGGWDWDQFTDWLSRRLEYAPLVVELAHLADLIDEQEGVLCAS
ncbi:MULTISPECIES: hypothetical protein [Nocardia]|uniref:hypothetical protein n=1 Tax=Nocardia TaxID=1817 RepID=UPI0002F8D06E|nr:MULTISPECIES: hypothetical protein [Nocardia]UGT50776.1 hypothetical protein LT345_09630 [Nocardia asteroides]SFN82961.1 hypothetical protein SAMN05444423_11554 [Nocardia asteroides]VEG36383.1 Putative amidoligase enzyme [Nocardia asteroides]